MSAQPTRATVALLCVTAVVVVGLAFPAAGLGTVPDSPIVDQRAAAPGSGGSSASGSGSGSSNGQTPTQTSTPAPTETPTPTPDDESAGTPFPTPTPSPTPPPTPEPEQSSNATSDCANAGDGSSSTTPCGSATDNSGFGPLEWLFGVVVTVLGTLSTLLVVVFPILLLVGGILTVGSAVTIEAHNRDVPVARRLPLPDTSVFAIGQRVSQATMGFVIGLSAGVPRVATDVESLANAATGGVGTGLAGLGRGVASLVVAIPRSIALGIAAIPGAFAGLRSGGALRTSATRSDLLQDEQSPEASIAGAAEESTETPTTVEDAWQAVVESLPVDDVETKTPVELAEAAVDLGLPKKPVYALTDAFRRVVYGGVSRTSDRTDRALGAYERLRNYLEGDR